jgi:hypothetical protein
MAEPSEQTKCDICGEETEFLWPIESSDDFGPVSQLVCAECEEEIESGQ